MFLSSLLDSLPEFQFTDFLKKHSKKNSKKRTNKYFKITQKNKEIAMQMQQAQASRFLKNMTYARFDQSRNSKQFPEIEIIEVVGRWLK